MTRKALDVARSWEEMRMVVSDARPSKPSINSSLMTGSSPLNGSSSTSNSGRYARD